MWVHPDPVKDEQWTTIISKKKQKMKSLSWHIISHIRDDNDTSTSFLTDLKEEQIILMTDETLANGTRSRKSYLKQLDTTNSANQQMGPSKDTLLSLLVSEFVLDKSKPKEVRFEKSQRKWAAEDLAASLKLDILAHLANILTYVTMHELLPSPIKIGMH